MKTVRAAMVVLAFFTLACAGSRVKYELLDSGAPTSGRDSDGEDSDAEDSDGEDSDGDSDLDEPYTHWYGVERYAYDFSTTPGNRECLVIWNVIGVPSTLECPDCLFAFDVTLYYDAANSTGSDNAGCFAEDQAFSYGYIEDYYGFPALAFAYDYGGTIYWIGFADAEFDASNDTLKYSSGSYVDYAYSGYYTGYVTYYYTRYYTGEAQLTR